MISCMCNTTQMHLWNRITDTGQTGGYGGGGVEVSRWKSLYLA